MHRFRSTWLALVGGAVIVALSLSVAIGADPVNEDEADANRGQTISGFVHSLIFAQDDPADEDTDEADEADEDLEEDLEEDTDEADEDLEEDLEEDTEEENLDDAAREVPAEFANHGECVSEAAHNKDAWEDEELNNHGEWVSMHARYICWSLPVPGEEAADEATTDEAALHEEADTEETSAEARAAAKAERAEARAAARAERSDARLAERANRGNGGGNGGGHGKP